MSLHDYTPTAISARLHRTCSGGLRACKINGVVTVYNKTIKDLALFFNIISQQKMYGIVNNGAQLQCLFFVIDAPCTIVLL